MTIPTLPIDFDSHGLIGTRSLRALQLVRIGRHPSSAMLIPRNGIWVVSGRGPETGSNGVGKTVLLGAISLLNGDPQWRGENGIGPNAARLLFDHNRARVADVRYADAPHGYIVGVYVHPGGLDDAITVWMRIERHSSTHVLVRWGHGVRLVDGDSEETRFAHANDLWPTLRDHETLKVTEYAEALYGKTPRCIAYIRARGSEENQDRGLLALGQRPFRPTDLANQIITLAGKQHAVDNERQFRQDLEAAESLLASKKAAFDLQYRREEQQLRDIADRIQARKLRDEAAKSWNLYLILATLLAYNAAKDLAQTLNNLEADVRQKNAEIVAKQAQLASFPSLDELVRLLNDASNGLNDATKEKNDLIEEFGANSQRQKDLKKNLAKLRAAAALAPGLSVPAAEEAVADAHRRRQSFDQTIGRIKDLYDKAKDHLGQLRAGRGGPAGQALEALNTEAIPAVSVLDLISLDNEERARWEARLSPYANAVLVPRSHVDRARDVLVKHPGTPMLVSGSELATVDESQPGGTRILAELLERLEERMPATGPVWVIDSTLGIEIPGGFHIPLTDRQAAIRAVEEELASLNGQLDAACLKQKAADKAVTGAENGLMAAKAAVELEGVQSEFDQLLAHTNALVGLIDTAGQKESAARDLTLTAEENYRNADRRRRKINDELSELKTGNTGLGQLLQKVTDAREKRRAQKEVVVRWQHVAEIRDPELVEEQLAEKVITLDDANRDACYQQARSRLRQAIEAILARTTDTTHSRGSPTSAGATGGDELHLKLNTGLHELHDWCDNPHTKNERARTFDIVAMPLTSWLNWNGADDDTTETEILANRTESRLAIEATETQTAETRMWIESQRDNQIAIITKAFQDTQKTLNGLLAAVNQDPIALRPRHTDLQDVNQPLRWELHPQWVPPGRKPVDYSNPPNTAELIIMHVLLATASLVAATNSQGRMLILDESGNNLDGPNLTRVSAVLQQVAKKYGLTVVLACQDIYTDRVARFGAGIVQLLRPSAHDPLNAPPDIIQGQEDQTVLDALMPYMNLERPCATTVSDGKPL